jgi:glutamate dehydrogenase
VLAPDQARVLADRTAAFTEQGVPPELAETIAQLALLAPACDVARLTRESARPLDQVARIYFGIGARFGFNWLRGAAARLPSDTAWNKLAVTALIEDIDTQQCDLARKVLALADREDPVEAWIESRHLFVHRAEQLLAELQSMAAPDLAMLAVGTRQLKSMTG